MISFSKIFQAIVFINIAILLINFAGIFPEQWGANIKPIYNNYKEIHDELKTIYNISEGNILQYMGAYGYIVLIGIKLVIETILYTPIYVGMTINNILGAFGAPSIIGTSFTVVSYLSFVLWIIDVFRGRSIE